MQFLSSPDYNFMVVLGWWLIVCCVRAGGVVCLCVCLLACFKAFSILKHIYIIFYMSDILFKIFYICDSLHKMYNYVILFRCIAKANYWGEATAYFSCHTISQQSPCHVSNGQSHQRLESEYGSINLAFVTLQNFNTKSFLLALSILPVTILTLMLRTYDT